MADDVEFLLLAASSRLSVIFVKDDAFSPHLSCNLLYGQENVERNGDKIVYVNDVIPLQSQMPNKHTLNKDSINSRNSEFYILGLVCNNSGVDHEILIEILKKEANLKSFCVLVVSINEIVRGKSLVLIHTGFSSQQTPFESSNIERMPQAEVRIVCVKHNLSISKLSCLYSVDVDRPVVEEGKHPKLTKHINGIRGRQEYTTEEYSTLNIRNETRNSNIFAVFKLLFLSVSWLLGLVQQSLEFPTLFKQLLRHLPKYLFVAKQLSHRFNQLYDMFVNRQETHKQDNIGSKTLTNDNLIVSLTIDIILGFAVIYFVFSNQHYLSISSWLIGQKYNIAEQLSNLLKWLMGAPAGLKLNIPLNQFLGNFYSYHVYLWTVYLAFIEAYLPTIILGCTLAGCLGVTFLLALLCDILSLLTVHIYCFYIYAARLFGLEIHVLSSLLRLFTGKKWNFLRSRVDSVEYDVDRLFIGTLLFTILLFLFPTIFLYYIVFTSLRILVLLVQSFLYGVVALLSSFPFFGLWLYFMDPEKLPGQIIVDTKKITCNIGIEDGLCVENVNVMQPDSCLYLSFRHKCLPCGDLFTNCRRVMFETTYRNTFGEGILYKLLTGQIISKP